MELTGKLKEQVDQTDTKEDAKKIIEEAGMELTDKSTPSLLFSNCLVKIGIAIANQLQ